MLGWLFGSASQDAVEGLDPVVAVDYDEQRLSSITYDDLAAYAGQMTPDPVDHSIFDGGKFAGGFGATQVQTVDYWTLRTRSVQLFTENIYARGLIRRLVTNEINTGLMPEACPNEPVLNLAVDSLQGWCETVETRYGLWAKSPHACDWFQRSTMGEIQRTARREALVSGDVLVVLRHNPLTQLPCVQLVSGASIQTPFGEHESAIAKGHEVRHGVQIDKDGRHVGFWCRQTDGSFKFIPAFGTKTGRRTAWLVYGCDKLMDEVRGQPLLSIVLQSLKEIDRYRDSTQRKTALNSTLIGFIKKTQDKVGSLPMTGSAVRKGTVTTAGDGATPPRKIGISAHMPGTFWEELQFGEEPELKGGEGVDTNFGTFEAAIIQAVAWCNECPPEILTLAFSNNYSASQAALNEFKIYLHLRWGIEGETFNTPIYSEWMVSEALVGGIEAGTLLAAWRDPRRYAELASWTSADWYGSIKPTTDVLKQVKGSELLCAGGFSTRAREARITTGTKFSTNIARLKRENEQLAEAMRPLLEIRAEFGSEQDLPEAVSDALLSAVETINERA